MPGAAAGSDGGRGPGPRSLGNSRSWKGQEVDVPSEPPGKKKHGPAEMLILASWSPFWTSGPRRCKITICGVLSL